MASFNIHLSVGVIASGIAATTMMVAGLASEQEVLAYFLLGTIGSLLPDLDSDSSVPVQVAFSIGSIVLAFLVMFLFVGTFFSVAELFLVWLATYFFFRWFIFDLFSRFTVHRGVFHTVVAALFFCCIGAIVGYRVIGVSAFQAWMGGAFLAFGYLVHLVLDEVYSVNLLGVQTKRSFGTAFKLWSKGSWLATLYLYAATAAALYAAPPLEPLQDTWTDTKVLQEIRTHLIPESEWFAPHRRG